MPHFGPTELIIILVVVLVVFGAGKLPQVGGAIGKSIREFRKESHGEEEAGKITAAKAAQPKES